MNDQLKSILEQQLRDVQTPEAVSWWPLAIGWWLVAAIVISLIIFSIIKLVKHRQRNAYKKLAVAELNQHFSDWQESQNNNAYLQAANAVLKRSCSYFNSQLNTPTASLSGRSWVVYLNAHCKTKFSNNTENALSYELYKENPTSDIDNVHQEVKTWLLKHSIEPIEQSNSTSELTHA